MIDCPHAVLAGIARAIGSAAEPAPIKRVRAVLRAVEPYIRMREENAVQTERVSTLVTIASRERSAAWAAQGTAIAACNLIAREKYKAGRMSQAETARECVNALRLAWAEEVV